MPIHLVLSLSSTELSILNYSMCRIASGIKYACTFQRLLSVLKAKVCNQHIHVWHCCIFFAWIVLNRAKLEKYHYFWILGLGLSCLLLWILDTNTGIRPVFQIHKSLTWPRNSTQVGAPKVKSWFPRIESTFVSIHHCVPKCIHFICLLRSEWWSLCPFQKSEAWPSGFITVAAFPSFYRW